MLSISALLEQPAVLPPLVRGAAAAIVTLLLLTAAAPWWIGWLKRRYREPIKSASPEVAALHAAKRDTPTMGGLFIVAAMVLALLTFGDRTNCYLPLAIVTTVALCAVGWADDWIKLHTARRGLNARAKFVAQTAIALAASALLFEMQRHVAGGTKLQLPLAGSFDMGWWFVPWGALVIVASSNAVNLSDGMDGLAAGCLLPASVALAIVAGIVGSESWSQTLGIAHIPAAGELAVVCAALAGGSVAFLWFNCHPAAVFMGDAGSLSLGGLLGLVAVILRQELLLVVIGGVFVVETLSVILQVTSFRCARRRIFRCAPLHHHFQLLGVREDKIVVRFWIAAGLCAVAGLATLAPAEVPAPSGRQSPAVDRLAGGARPQDFQPPSELFP